MARTGLFKSEVKKARDALLAQQKHPSVDAVRIALGNTGSKTTIHKYLKELEEEDGGSGGRKASISDALQDLVERLAARLQDEANFQGDALRVEYADMERRHAEAQAALQRQVERLEEQLQQTAVALQQEQATHGTTREALQMDTVARHTAEQQVVGLRERLTENEAHLQSLEDKHRHAREALEHYRQSVKDQRDQDQRRHEQQLQQLQAELRTAGQTIVVKQKEVTRLNQEGVRLVAELSHAQKALYDEQARTRRLTQQVEALQAAEQRCNLLAMQAAASEAQADELKKRYAEATQQVAALTSQVNALQIAYAALQAKLDAQQTMTAQLHAYMANKEVSSSTEDRPA